jgi:hypothetical protein
MVGLERLQDSQLVGRCVTSDLTEVPSSFCQAAKTVSHFFFSQSFSNPTMSSCCTHCWSLKVAQHSSTVFPFYHCAAA